MSSQDSLCVSLAVLCCSSAVLYIAFISDFCIFVTSAYLELAYLSHQGCVCVCLMTTS